MSNTLQAMKADLFKALGNPLRIRVLELLCVREHAVGEMLTTLGVEPSALSQQLAVLRSAGLVTSRREVSAVHYAVSSPEVAELLGTARRLLAGRLTDQVGLLSDLRAEQRRAGSSGA